MRKRRLSSGEISAKRYEEKRLAMKHFETRLQAVRSVADARRLLESAPPVGAIDRPLYSNFAFFYENGFVVPGSASPHELDLYVGLIERLTKAGEIGADDGAKAIRALRSS